MVKLPSLSVVIPVYNSANTLEPLVAALSEVAPLVAHRYEIILVDDASNAETQHILQQLKCLHSSLLHILHLPKNQGQHQAINIGIQQAQNAWVATLDDDLQIHPKELIKLVQAQHRQQADLVYGTIPFSQKNLWAQFNGYVGQVVLQGTFSPTCRMTSFRLMKTSLAKRILAQLPLGKHFAPAIHCHAHSISTVGIIKQARRTEGRSTYNLWKRWKLLAEMLPSSSVFLHYLVTHTFGWVVWGFLSYWVLEAPTLLKAILWGTFTTVHFMAAYVWIWWGYRHVKP